MNTKWRLITEGVLTSLLFFGGTVLGTDLPASGGLPGPTPASPGKRAPGAVFRGDSPAPISPFAAEALLSKGKKLPNLFPNADNNGQKFNPGAHLITPLTTAPEQKILVVFVEFTTPPYGGPEERRDLRDFDNLLFGTEYDPPDSGGKEYFLLENRQHIGFDQGLATIRVRTRPDDFFSAGHGLAIWHVDDTVLSRAYIAPNEAENWKEFRSEGWQKAWTGETHYGISLIQADDQWDLEHFMNAAGDLGDLYPGSLGITHFGSDTFPNSSSYYFWPGSEPKFGLSGITVENITEEPDGTIKADLSFTR